jgi:hypothetical protein
MNDIVGVRATDNIRQLYMLTWLGIAKAVFGMYFGLTPELPGCPYGVLQFRMRLSFFFFFFFFFFLERLLPRLKCYSEKF